MNLKLYQNLSLNLNLCFSYETAFDTLLKNLNTLALDFGFRPLRAPKASLDCNGNVNASSQKLATLFSKLAEGALATVFRKPGQHGKSGILGKPVKQLKHLTAQKSPKKRLDIRDAPTMPGCKGYCFLIWKNDKKVINERCLI